MTTIVYLHGFISSPRSRKAALLGEYLSARAPDVEFVVPELHHRPAQAVSQVQWHCLGRRPGELALFGSSLGGFYATVVAEKLGCRAALLNPAVNPHRVFARLVGPQRNPYTGEAFELTMRHVEELEALAPSAITRPERYRLLVETGDEVLDHREALAFYAGAHRTVVPGGDHALASFPAHVPDLVHWARS